MRRKILSALAVIAGVAALTVLWSSEAYAQGRVGRVRHARPVVAVSAYHFAPHGNAWQRFPYPYPYMYRIDHRADLRIQGSPREAQVYLDGYFVGTVDDFDGFAQRLRVEPGEHDVQIYLQGYRTRTERMLFRPNESYKLSFALEPLAAGETPDPQPIPSAAGPSAERRVPTRRGYAAARESLGTLSIRIQPLGATVLINGERWEWPDGEDRLEVDVPPGQHRIEVQLEGHQPYATMVTVRPGETTTLNVSLPRQD